MKKKNTKVRLINPDEFAKALGAEKATDPKEIAKLKKLRKPHKK